MKISNHKVLITGGSSGIGLALAKKFVSAGNMVVITGRDLIKLEAIKENNPEIEIFQCDLTKQAQIDALIVFIEQKHLDLNILINNAGVQYNYELLAEASLGNKIDYEMNINLLAPIKLCVLLLPTLMRNSDPMIVNISSALAFAPKRSAPVYSASKAAIHSFTKGLRYQLSNTMVKIFEVFPPLVDTQMTEGRERNKISPAQLADEFMQYFAKGKLEIYIGKTKILHAINQISPTLVDLILKNG